MGADCEVGDGSRGGRLSKCSNRLRPLSSLPPCSSTVSVKVRRPPLHVINWPLSCASRMYHLHVRGVPSLGELGKPLHVIFPPLWFSRGGFGEKRRRRRRADAFLYLKQTLRVPPPNPLPPERTQTGVRRHSFPISTTNGRAPGTVRLERQGWFKNEQMVTPAQGSD